MNLTARTILLALISTTIIFSGCSKKDKVEAAEPVKIVAKDKLQDRNGVYFEVNQETPFTGKTQGFYPDGQMKSECNYKDGKKHGVANDWHKNGQKIIEMNFKDGKAHGEFTAFYKNGQKATEESFKNGKWHGVKTTWDESGKKTSEVRYKDGVIQD